MSDAFAGWPPDDALIGFGLGDDAIAPAPPHDTGPRRARSGPRTGERLAGVNRATLLSIALAAGCGGARHLARPITSGSLILPLAPRLVGLHWTRVEDRTYVDQAVGNRNPVATIGTSHDRADSRIVEVGADGVMTRIAVSYPERDDTTGGSRQAPWLLLHRSYVAWIEGGAVAGTHADGSSVRLPNLPSSTRRRMTSASRP